MYRVLRVLLLILPFIATNCYAQQLYINELSQGASGSKEYVEFVVSGTRTCTDSTMDIRNFIFDDNPGWYTTTSVGAGCYRFANISNWAAVKYGSLIVIYNSADKNANLPADDSTDANGDGVYVLPSTCSFLQVNTASPASGGSTTYNYSTAVGGTWSAPVAASWGNTLALGNGGDAFHIINPAVSTTVAAHSISYGTATGGVQTANIYFASLGSSTVGFHTGSTPLTQAAWTTGTATASTATTAETPGAANGTANASWIASLKTANAIRLYVDGSVAVSGTGASWASPYQRLTDALRAANAGTCPTEIWVKAGTYYPTTSTNRDSSFRITRNGIKVYGGFAGTETLLAQRNITANTTILSGDIGVLNDSTDNVYHVFVIGASASSPIDSTTMLSGLTITRGQANGTSGIFYGGAGVFRDNGGGVNMSAYNGLTCSPKIDSCTFTLNVANWGGGLFSSAHISGKNSPVVNVCTFTNNKSLSFGGGYAAFGDNTNPVMSPQFRNCTFISNQSGGGGSAFAIYSSTTTGKSLASLSNCTFSNNSGSNTTMYGTVFVRGGGGLTDTVKPSFTDCSFSGNSAARGGGIYLEYGPVGTISNCVFTTNNALSYGGAVSLADAGSAISNSSFTSNTAINGTSYAAGGAISIFGGSTRRYHTISNCSFTQNKAYNDGGAILAQDSNVIDMKGITSIGNKAQGGGGFLQTQVQYTLTMTIDSSTFSNDTALVYGGIIRCGNPGTTTYTNCKFQNGYGVVTGAFDQYLNGTQIFRNCLFNNNKSDQYGAALHAYQVNDTLINCVFVNNAVTTTSGNGGGAIHTNTSSIIAAYNCTFYNNTSATTNSYAGCNQFSWEGSPTAVFNNCIVWGTAQLTQGGSGGTRTFNNCLVKNVALSAPNLTVDPNFVNASNPIGADNIWGTADDGLRLTQCSRAINAGDNARVLSSTTTDFAGGARIQNTTVDMGAYESAFSASGFNPFVTITSTPAPVLCGGGTIAFYAALNSPGGSNTYQWYRNGSPVGTNSTNYSATFNSSDSVTVKVTNSWCPSYDIYAAERVIVSNPPSVSITGPGNPSCAGATLTANSNINPLAIQWNLNGSPLVMQNTGYGTGTTVAGNGTAGSGAGQINAPWGMYVDRYRNVYVAEQGGNRITKWSPPYTSGTLVAGTGTAASAPHELNSPGDVYVDDYGYVYIADRFNVRVQRWAPGANTAVTVAGGNGIGNALNQFTLPASVVVDDSSNIYVTDFNSHRVMKWAPGATAGTIYAGTGTSGSALNQFNFPSYLYWDRTTRNLYITDEGNHRIMMWAPNASSGTVVAGGNGAGSNGNQLNSPRGVAKDAAGNLYINDGGNNRIVVWQPGASAGTTVAAGNGGGNAANQLNFPLDMDVDSSGNIYVADGSNHRVQRFSPTINNTILAVSPGTYTATITPPNGCQATTAGYTINPLPLSSVDTSAPVICAGDTVSITATSNIIKGNSLDFDGTVLNYAAVADGAATSLAGLNNFTVTAWINPRSNAHQNIVLKGKGCSTWSEWALGIGGNETNFYPGKIAFLYRTGNGPNTSFALAGIPSVQNVSLNTWTHVAVTYDGSKLRLYLNGVLENEVPFTSGTPWANPDSMYIGGDAGCGGRTTYTGRIDELSVWNTTLSQANIGGIMKGIIPSATSGLKGYWRFDEMNGKKIYDSGPNAQYGLLSGSNYVREIPSTAPLNNAATGAVSYAWSPATGLNTTTGATVKASPSVTTQYTLTTTHTATGCANITRVTVDVNALPTAGVTPNGTVTSCSASPVTLVADSALGYTWQWYNGGVIIAGATGRRYTPVASGTYTVRISNVAGCSVTSAVVNVTTGTTVTPSISITASPSSTICAGTSVTFTATSANGGSLSAIQWLKNGVPVGTGAATYTDAALTNGATIQARFISNVICRTADTVFSNVITVTVNPQPAIASVTVVNPTTCGGTDGSISITGLTPNTAYTVSYFNGVTTTTLTSQMSNASGVITISSLPAGTYSNIVVALGPCSATYSSFVTLTPPSAPAGPVAGNNGPICAGGTLNLTANTIAGGTYNWAGPNGFTSTAQNPTISNAQTNASGTYSVTVTVAGCVSVPGTTTVTVNPTPVIAGVTGTNPTACGGTNGSIAISGLTPLSIYTVNYSFGGTPQPSLTLNADASGIVTITGLSIGTYTGFSVTLGSCPSAVTGSVTLVNPAAPATPVANTNAPVCAGATLNLSTTATGVTYSWTGPNGFSSTLQNPSIPGATTAATGVYTLVVTSTVTGCVASPASVSATVNAVPAISSSSITNPVTCNGNSGSITLNGLNASSIYSVTYLKNGTPQSATITSNASGSVVITGLTAGVYTNIAVAQNGCTSTPIASLTLTDPAPPAAPVPGSNSPVCQGTTLSLTATGASGASYNWTGPGSFSSSTQNPTVTTNMQSANAGVYSVTQTVAGCVSAAATVSVAMSTVPAAPGAISGNTTPCVGQAYNYSISSVATATSYTWTIPGTAGWSTTGSTTTTISVTAGAANGTLSVVANNVCGSSSSATLALQVNSAPVQPLGIGGPTSICNGSTAAWQIAPISNATSYTWTLPTGWAGGSTGSLINGTASANSGTISVVANNVCGSSPAQNLAVTVITIPSQPGVISGSTTPCVGSLQTYSIAAVAGATSYAWSYPTGGTPAWIGGSLTNAIPLTVGTNNGNVAVAAVNQCGSSAPQTLGIVVTQIPAKPVSVTGNTAPCVGSVATYKVSPVAGATYYVWSFPASWVGASTIDSINLIAGSGTATISVAAANACGTGQAQTLNVSAVPVLAPSVKLSRSTASDTICSGTQVTFTATPTNGGSAPVYVFRKNGTVVLSAGNSYTDGGLASGDRITVSMASSLPCVTATQVSDSIRMTVIPTVMPGININSVPPTTLCAGATLTFTTNIVAGGPSPAYQWYKNGVSLGVTTPTYTTASLLNNDTIQVLLTTSATCPAVPAVFSNKVGIRVNPLVVPTVTISASPSGAVPTGTPVTFTAIQSGGGTTPAYQWMKNNVALPGETNSSYTSSSLKSGDRISVRLQSYDPCANPAMVTSNEIVMEVGSTSVVRTSNWEGMINLYPNPTSGHFTIAASIEGRHVGKRTSVMVLNALGQTVYQTELRPDRTQWSHEVWLSEQLSNGSYILRLSTEDGMIAALPFLLGR